jgi:hypothetical protein
MTLLQLLYTDGSTSPGNYGYDLVSSELLPDKESKRENLVVYRIMDGGLQKVGGHSANQYIEKIERIKITYNNNNNNNNNNYYYYSVDLVRERTIPTERPPFVAEVSANFCGWRGCRVVSATDPLRP